MVLVVTLRFPAGFLVSRKRDHGLASRKCTERPMNLKTRGSEQQAIDSVQSYSLGPSSHFEVLRIPCKTIW